MASSILHFVKDILIVYRLSVKIFQFLFPLILLRLIFMKLILASILVDKLAQQQTLQPARFSLIQFNLQPLLEDKVIMYQREQHPSIL